MQHIWLLTFIQLIFCFCFWLSVPLKQKHLQLVTRRAKFMLEKQRKEVRKQRFLELKRLKLSSFFGDNKDGK